LRWKVTAKRRIVCREHDRLGPVAREEHFLLLRDAHGHEGAEPDRLERIVGGRDLPAPAVDQDQIGERPSLLERLPIPPLHHFPHRREVVRSGCGMWDSGFGI
jgi:hypothetical protein